MRHLAIVAAFAVSAVAFGPGALADIDRTRAKPTRSRVSSSMGRAAVYVGRRAVWRAAKRHTRIITPIRWSRTKHALAFATRNRRGVVTLKVVLMHGHARGHALSWQVPHRLSVFRKAPNVTWIGKRKVAFGRSSVRPDLVASWRAPK